MTKLIRPSGRSKMRAQRTKQSATYEEQTENHGASKRVKIHVETHTDTIEVSTDDENFIPDVQDVEELIEGRRPDKLCLTNNAETSNQDYVDYEEVNDEDDDEISEEELEGVSQRDPSTYMLASEMLRGPEVSSEEVEPKVDVCHTKSTFVSSDKTSVHTIEHIEYKRSCLYEPVSFEQFKEPEKFLNNISLEHADVKTCIKNYVNSKAHSMPKIRVQYRMLLSYILKLEKEYNFVVMPIVVGNQFWDEFQSYLINNNLAPNTIAAICGHLRTVLRWASMFKASVSVDLDNIDFEAKDIKPKISLDEDDISRIYWFDINSLHCRPQKKKTFERIRDHFVLSCYLGQRFSDVCRIRKENFNTTTKSSFSIIQQKTGFEASLDFNKIYGTIPKHVQDILVKYGYKSPYQGHLSNFNRYLKELMCEIGMDETIKYEYKIHGKVITNTFKKWELISSHTARRSFITNAVKRGVHTEFIKHASGHRSDRSFGKYVIFD